MSRRHVRYIMRHGLTDNKSGRGSGQRRAFDHCRIILAGEEDSRCPSLSAVHVAFVDGLMK
jgi:hypothetical protein